MNLKTCAIVLLFCAISINLFAQSIPNSSFENWSQKTYYDDLDQFTTSNPLTYVATETANVTKTTDAHSGNYAAKMETIGSDGGPIPGAVFIGQIGEGAITGGVPFIERPDSIIGFAKYDIQTLDTAYVAVLFKLFGAPIGICFIQFTGAQNDWEEFTAPISWLVPVLPPDTMATVIVSSTIFDLPIPGSTITVDDIHFTGITTPYPNGGFEDWTELSGEEPDEWFSSNVFTIGSSGSSVVKTEDSYQGTYASMLESKLTIIEDTMAFVSNGQLGDDGPIGGMPVDNIPDKLTGYYKYFPDGPDTALVGVTLYRYNDNTGNTSVLDETILKLPAASEYTAFELPVSYDQYPLPDTANIIFSAGNIDNDSSYYGLGSILYVDELEITYKPPPTAIENKLTKDDYKTYPNPAINRLNFEFTEAFQNDIDITILNLLGKSEQKETILAHKSQSFSLDISKLESGIYFYRVQSFGTEEFTGKFFVK